MGNLASTGAPRTFPPNPARLGSWIGPGALYSKHHTTLAQFRGSREPETIEILGDPPFSVLAVNRQLLDTQGMLEPRAGSEPH